LNWKVSIICHAQKMSTVFMIYMLWTLNVIYQLLSQYSSISKWL
jgi:hypothetical protein